jgi:trimeric autotransporter adhesin
VDATGDIFVGDSGNARVRRISASGIITTVAGGGSGAVYVEGGAATTAAFIEISGLALDGSGNLYISDSGYDVVRMVSPKGIITAVAGTGTYGYSGDGGPAVKARLSAPSGLAIDGLGNIFIADSNNSCVRKVAVDGTITTFAGTGFSGFPGDNGPAVSAQLAYPQGIALDGSGNLLIADSDNYRIRKVSANGTISTIAGNGTYGLSGDGGPASSAELAGVGDIAVDGAGNILIDGSGNQNTFAFVGVAVLNSVGPFFFTGGGGAPGISVLRKISAAGTISTVAGNGASGLYGVGGAATAARFGSVHGVAADGSGNVFVADSVDNSVLKISAAGIVTVVAGNGTYGFTGDGGLATLAELADPAAVAVDGAGDLFIADAYNGRIRKVASNGIITTVAGDGDAGYAGDGGLATSAEIAPPVGVAVDGSGNIFILDSTNSVVRKVAANGVITTFAGNGITGNSGDNGPAIKATLNNPMGIAVDAAGDVFIADTYNYAVRKVSTSGTITTVAGGSSALLNDPTGVAVDGAGSLFIADNVVIQRVSASTGIMTPIAQPGYEYAIAADAQGDVFLADSSSNSVRKLTPASQTVTITSVVDAASERAGPVSPGEIIVIYGGGMGPAQGVTAAPTGGVFGTTLAGTTVTVNGVAAPVFYASATQVNAIVPYEVSGATAGITVAYQGGISSAVSVPVAASSSNLFTYNATGAGEAAAFNVIDGTVNSATNPVKTGGYIELFATGAGQTSPGGVDGKLAALPLPSPVGAVSATVGGVAAVVQYKGAVWIAVSN